MRFAKYIWPVIGLIAVAFSVWLLYHELRSISLDGLIDSLDAISAQRWFLCLAATLVAYLALAGYDRLALMHLGRHISLLFITICSFTAYALSHNIGASVFSGAMVRYRAYSTKGLSTREVGILVGFCSFTFGLGVVLLMGLVLILRPDIPDRFADILPMDVSWATGVLMLGCVGLYVLGSVLPLGRMGFRRIALIYPKPGIVFQQLLIGPLELIGAAAIIYFALPADGPGFIIVLGIFLLSFSVALVSHAPGGLGVLELVFVAGLSDMDPNDVLAALIVFRLFYLIVPFILALIVILFFERAQMMSGGAGEKD